MRKTQCLRRRGIWNAPHQSHAVLRTEEEGTHVTATLRSKCFCWGLVVRCDGASSQPGDGVERDPKQDGESAGGRMPKTETRASMDRRTQASLEVESFVRVQPITRSVQRDHP